MTQNIQVGLRTSDPFFFISLDIVATILSHTYHYIMTIILYIIFSVKAKVIFQEEVLLGQSFIKLPLLGDSYCNTIITQKNLSHAIVLVITLKHFCIIMHS